MNASERVGVANFSHHLQRTAYVLASPGIRQPGTDRIVDSVNEEIGLVADQLARVRKKHASTRSLMTELECEVGTDLLSMETPRWWYGPNREARWRDRQRLKSRRAQLKMDRMTMENTLEQARRQLEDRLLGLIQRRLTLEETPPAPNKYDSRRGHRR